MNDLNDTLEKKEIANEINASIKKLEDKNAFRLCAVVVLIAICAIFAIIGAFVNTEEYWMVVGLFVFLPCGLAILCFSALIYEIHRDIKLVNKKISEMEKNSSFCKNEESASHNQMSSDNHNTINEEHNTRCKTMTTESKRIYLSFYDYGVDLLADKHIITYQLSKIDPFDFEKFVANLFSSIGYMAYATKASGDYGCDAIAEKDGIRLAIQCKHREDPDATVDQKAIREIHAAKDVSEYRADKAFVVTNGKFTPAAKKLAYDLRVGLWDCEDLLKKLNDIKNTLRFIEPKEGE